MVTKKLKRIISVAIAVIGLVGSIIAIWSCFETAMIAEIGGEWAITDRIETGPYSGTTIEFKIFLTQEEGGVFKGTGEKWSENGKVIPSSQRTSLSIIGGSIDGENIKATFIEHGSKRETRGQFFWELEGNDLLAGTYYTTSSKGSSTGKKIR